MAGISCGEKGIIILGYQRSKKDAPTKFGVRLKKWGLQMRVGCRWPDVETARIVRDRFCSCVRYEHKSVDNRPASYTGARGTFHLSDDAEEKCAGKKVQAYLKFTHTLSAIDLYQYISSWVDEANRRSRAAAAGRTTTGSSPGQTPKRGKGKVSMTPFASCKKRRRMPKLDLEPFVSLDEVQKIELQKWSHQEILLFEDALRAYGQDFKTIALLMKTKSEEECSRFKDIWYRTMDSLLWSAKEYGRAAAR